MSISCIHHATVPIAPYLSDSLEYLLLVRIHLGECADLCQVDALAVTEGNDLIECEDERERLISDVCLLHRLAVLRDLKHRTICTKSMYKMYTVCSILYTMYTICTHTVQRHICECLDRSDYLETKSSKLTRDLRYDFRKLKHRCHLVLCLPLLPRSKAILYLITFAHFTINIVGEGGLG